MKNIAILSAVLALPSLAAANPQQACRSLVAQAEALLGAGQLHCEPKADGTLAVETAETAGFDRIRANAFPQDTFQSFRVVRDLTFRIQPVAGSLELRDAVISPEHTVAGTITRALSSVYTFDGAARRGDFVLTQGGPPGQMPPNLQFPKDDRPQQPRSGPPGQVPQGQVTQPKAGPPGQLPPGSRPPQQGRPDDRPPVGSQPPSRPTPVFIPDAPRPNWWNTLEERDITYWQRLPDNWSTSSQFDEQRNRYTTPWYVGRKFATRSGMTTDTERRDRTIADMGRTYSIDMESREIDSTKQCYYQGVYDLTWNSFEGRWDGRFSHYRAACVRDTEYGDRVRTNVQVEFDMQGQSLLPWEREQLVATYNGSTPHVDVQNPAFQYQLVQRGNWFGFRATQKLRTAPDREGVSAVLMIESGRLVLRVADKWHQQYQGETLEVSAKIERVNESWNPFASNHDVAEYSVAAGNQLSWTPQAPGMFDTVVPDQGRGRYYIASWSFRRVNRQDPMNQSRLSLDTQVQKGSGPRVSK